MGHIIFLTNPRKSPAEPAPAYIDITVRICYNKRKAFIKMSCRYVCRDVPFGLSLCKLRADHLYPTETERYPR